MTEQWLMGNNQGEEWVVSGGDEDGRVRGRGEDGGDVMGGGGGIKPPSTLACQKYHCDMCNVPIISYDLKHHYRNLTNWDQLEKL